jgi:hypothetical protein
MILELRGHHNERILRIDTSDYEHCQGIFIETTPPDYFPLFPPICIADLPDPPTETL